MDEPFRSRRGGLEVQRSQVAFELALYGYAVVATVVALRLLLRLLTVSHRLWVSGLIYRLTDPIVVPLEHLPGGSQRLIGGVTVPDLTLAGMLALVPLLAIIRPGRGGPKR